MRVTSKGQVTIPQHIRERAGFLPGTEIDFVLDDSGGVRVRRATDQPGDAVFRAWLETARGSADSGMSTDEIMALTRG